MSKLTNQTLFHFCEQFALLLRAGIPAADCLHILSEDSPSPKTKEILLSLMKTTDETGSLSKAFAKSGLFPDYVISYTKTGEETGCLDEVMESLASHYEYESEMSEHIKSAVTYPLIMSGMMFAVIIILLCKVLPVFQQVFRQMGMELTGFSLGLLKTGERISTYSTILVILLFLFIGMLVFFFFHSKGRSILRKITFKLPGIKKIPIYMDYSRLSQGISMGIRSGLSPDESMTLALELVSHPEIVAPLKKAQELMHEGTRFSESLIKSGLYTGMEGRLILISVQAGAIDEVMSRLANRYNERSISAVSQIISIVEPTIVIALSILVGLVLLSVMMPLLGILSQMMV